MFKVIVVAPNGKKFLVAKTKTLDEAQHEKDFYANHINYIKVEIQKEEE